MQETKGRRKESTNEGMPVAIWSKFPEANHMAHSKNALEVTCVPSNSS